MVNRWRWSRALFFLGENGLPYASACLCLLQCSRMPNSRTYEIYGLLVAASLPIGISGKR